MSGRGSTAARGMIRPIAHWAVILQRWNGLSRAVAFQTISSRIAHGLAALHPC